ncbi:MAG: hypothetical protein HYW62_03650 [Candidatus Levybacteria bacterium]|nr:hypothetical protein [Candidatus Levybacteria bacterium]
MSIFSSYKKIFLLGFIIIILIAIPFSVYIAQQRQRTTTKAAASTTLSFDPASTGGAPVATKVGETLTLNVVLDPSAGTPANQVSFVKLSITFDSSKFTAESFKPSTDPKNTLTSVLEEASLTSGRATISLSIGADPTKVVTTKTKIAILKLKALSVTTPGNPSSVTFGSDTQVLSIASSDQTSENVLSTTSPAIVTINSASVSASPTPTTAILTITPTSLPGNAPSPTLSPSGGNAALIIATSAPTLQPLPTPTFFPQVILPPTGPSENILGIGIVGMIFTIIGGILFLLL